MKKAVTIFMLCLYGLAVTGTTINIHYCMNRLTGISITASNTKVCSNCGMQRAKSNGCCHDEQKQIKPGGDHQLAEGSSNVPLLSPYIIASPPLGFNYTVTGKPQMLLQPSGKAPPNILSNNIYLRHRMLLI
jgi:hypothetical protein